MESNFCQKKSDEFSPAQLYARFCELKERRSAWESLWRECYAYAFPHYEGFSGSALKSQTNANLFDATASDATDQLAASMFAELTPSWSRWFGLTGGVDISASVSSDKTASSLTGTAEIIQYHFDRSNFAQEVHQCYLDLVTAGTASLLFEENKVGESSAFHFTAVPLAEICLDEGPSGRLDVTYRCSATDYSGLVRRFPKALDLRLTDRPFASSSPASEKREGRIKIIEAVLPRLAGGYAYTAFIAEDETGIFASNGEMPVLKSGVFESSPFINFRWQKAAGEVYGRSPVMKALPDIKTANKVVELILKNAAIAVTGIWQAEDDGVLNPANIRLVPGAIIPKAVGSKGLTPLEAPGNFDLSDIVLADLRTRINHALLNDRLGQINTPTLTATEVLERSAQMVRILGATYGRLQSELLTPLITRAIGILRRRGEIPALYLDGRMMRLEYASPLAKSQAHRDAGNTLSWLSSVAGMGAKGIAAVDMAAAARWLGKTLGVPSELIKENSESAPDIIEQIATAVSDIATVKKGAPCNV